MAESKGKRYVVCLSSSSEEEEEDSDVVYLSSDDDGYQEDQVLEVIESDGSDDDRDEEEEEEGESEDPNEDEQDNNDDESRFNKIIRLLREHRELGSLKLKDCKAYLRTNGLRVTGAKSVCLQRIKEHWRLKDGNGESFYPRSSFSINCTGDVCRGDVVLFRQKVYEKLDNVSRHGRVLGKRVVAGRVVKESYGTAKQQHTFTVEVLWSRGIKKLPLLYPLLIKGRNLYRMRTYRQRWHNESERLKVLAEKHRRGDAARLERETRKSKKWTSNRGKKHRGEFHSEGRSKMRKTNDSKKGRDNLDGLKKTTLQGHRVYSDNQQKDSISRASEHFKGYEKFTCRGTSKYPSSRRGSDLPRIRHQYQQKSQQRSTPYPCLRQDRSMNSTTMDYSDHRQKDLMFRASEHFKGCDKFTRNTSKDPSFETCSDPLRIPHQYQLRSQPRSELYPCLREEEDWSADSTVMDYSDHRQQDSMFRASDHFKGCDKFTRSTSKVPRFETCSDLPHIPHHYQRRSQQRSELYPCLREDWSADPTMIDYSEHQQKDSMFRASEHFSGYEKFTKPSTSKEPSFQTCSDPPHIPHQYQLRSQKRSALHPCLREDMSAAPTMTDYTHRQQKDSMLRASEPFNGYEKFTRPSTSKDPSFQTC